MALCLFVCLLILLLDYFFILMFYAIFFCFQRATVKQGLLYLMYHLQLLTAVIAH